MIHEPFYAVLKLTLLCLIVSGCNRKSEDSAALAAKSREPTTVESTRGTINVAAAADLRFTMDALIAGFVAQHSDAHVKTTFGASGNLAAQISNGAPFDVFMSADAGFPDKLIAQQAALAETRFVYALGTLVLWVPNQSEVTADAGLPILKLPSFHKIAIANPKLAPYGRAAEAALKKAELWEAVKDRIVLGENIAQTAQFLMTGAADAGLVSKSLAIAEPLKSAGKTVPIPDSDYAAIEQVAVVIAATHESDEAKAFCAFVASDAGRAILESHGLRPPPK